MGLLQLAALASVVVAALASVMAVAWRVQRRTGSTGWIDVYWTFGVGGVAVAAALLPISGGPWPHLRQVLVACLAALWSVRLGAHIVARTRKAGDDPRYRHMIEQWGASAGRRMFWQLQAQAAVGAVLALSIGLAAHNPHSGLRLQDALGLLLLLGAIVGEGLADRQLRRFKAEHPGAICDTGLWRWSRHPNYFFEWLVWVAYPVIAIDLTGANPWGWLALLAPACMYWVLVHVSGVPPLEEHMLRVRRDAFSAYQRRTRPFLPFPKRG